jgi:hypothetical protein
MLCVLPVVLKRDELRSRRFSERCQKKGYCFYGGSTLILQSSFRIRLVGMAAYFFFFLVKF